MNPDFNEIQIHDILELDLWLSPSWNELHKMREACSRQRPFPVKKACRLDAMIHDMWEDLMNSDDEE